VKTTPIQKPARILLWTSLIVAAATAWSAVSARRTTPLIVPTVSAEEVFKYLREGRKVIFIDAREGAEYNESHIPGALNLSLRELEQMGPRGRELLGDPDLVVAYCLKDFRGFEVARALQGLGVTVASTLSEQGINGWKQRGLPVTQAGTTGDSEVERALAACVESAALCGASK
jgi:rhodanese-related sulfurtransferase